MSKLRVIDLLNKIANGEIEPNIELFYKKEKYRHIDNLFGDYYVEEVLNDEVEIIGEDKKIPAKIDQNDREWHYLHNTKKTTEEVADNLEHLRQKVNQIIDCLEENK